VCYYVLFSFFTKYFVHDLHINNKNNSQKLYVLQQFLNNRNYRILFCEIVSIFDTHKKLFT